LTFAAVTAPNKHPGADTEPKLEIVEEPELEREAVSSAVAVIALLKQRNVWPDVVTLAVEV